MRSGSLAAALALFLTSPAPAAADEPKKTPENTIAVQLTEPVKPQTFPRPLKFFVEDVVDRSGEPQPMLVYRQRGGVFLDREPTKIVRQALEDSLRAAGMLAPDRASADEWLTVYLFHFGLGSGSGMEYFGKVELNVVVKDARTGKTETVTALGTSVKGAAMLKKNIQKNVKTNLEEALADSLRNFLRGTKLREAIESLAAPPHPTAFRRGNPARRAAGASVTLQ